jgi:hypothetical protein
MTTNPFVQCFFLNKGRFLISTKKYVIPAKAGIQFFQNLLDAPGLQIAGAGSSSPA